MPYETYREAMQALEDACADVAADFGEEAVEAAWGDLVRNVASQCTPEVYAELVRRNL